jgi:hypothetical protein
LCKPLLKLCAGDPTLTDGSLEISSKNKETPCHGEDRDA